MGMMAINNDLSPLVESFYQGSNGKGTRLQKRPSLSMHDLQCGGTDPSFALVDAEISHKAQR
jgi:hypothetical protein